jgi:hypothetical protein
VHEPGTRGALRTQHTGFELAALPDAGGDAERFGAAAVLDHRECATLGEGAEFVGDLG